MKKIGILYGMENSFPEAFIARVNEKLGKTVAESVTIDKLLQGRETEYAVIIDRISQDVPFYRAYLKNAALQGTAVINNPFWWSADEKFFNNCLAKSLGVPVPETALLPSKENPTDTTSQSFRNLKMPLDWQGMSEEVGFPAYMKPHDGGGWKNVYQVENLEDMWQKHNQTGQLVMMLQEEIKFDDYFRCYAIGGSEVRIMPYNPLNPHASRYNASIQAKGEEARDDHTRPAHALQRPGKVSDARFGGRLREPPHDPAKRCFLRVDELDLFQSEKSPRSDLGDGSQGRAGQRSQAPARHRCFPGALDRWGGLGGAALHRQCSRAAAERQFQACAAGRSRQQHLHRSAGA